MSLGTLRCTTADLTGGGTTTAGAAISTLTTGAAATTGAAITSATTFTSSTTGAAPSISASSLASVSAMSCSRLRSASAAASASSWAFLRAASAAATSAACLASASAWSRWRSFSAAAAAAWRSCSALARASSRRRCCSRFHEPILPRSVARACCTGSRAFLPTAMMALWSWCAGTLRLSTSAWICFSTSARSRRTTSAAAALSGVVMAGRFSIRTSSSWWRVTRGRETTSSDGLGMSLGMTMATALTWHPPSPARGGLRRWRRPAWRAAPGQRRPSRRRRPASRPPGSPCPCPCRRGPASTGR